MDGYYKDKLDKMYNESYDKIYSKNKKLLDNVVLPIIAHFKDEARNLIGQFNEFKKTTQLDKESKDKIYYTFMTTMIMQYADNIDEALYLVGKIKDSLIEVDKALSKRDD